MVRMSVSSRPTPSIRRSQIEEKRARQTALMVIGGSLVALVLMVVFVMPLAFNFITEQARRTSSGGEEDALPPQRPVIAPPKEFQNTGDIAIEGYTEAQAKVSLYVDAQESQSMTADGDGNFKFTLSLGEGDHVVWLQAFDEADNASELTQEYRIVVDKTVPTLTVDEPADGAVYTLPRERALTVKGKASEQVVVTIGSAQVTSADDGSFSVVIQLGQGENNLIVVAEDQAGNRSTEVTRKVSYFPQQ